MQSQATSTPQSQHQDTNKDTNILFTFDYLFHSLFLSLTGCLDLLGRDREIFGVNQPQHAAVARGEARQERGLRPGDVEHAGPDRDRLEDAARVQGPRGHLQGKGDVNGGW